MREKTGVIGLVLLQVLVCSFGVAQIAGQVIKRLWATTWDAWRDGWDEFLQRED